MAPVGCSCPLQLGVTHLPLLGGPAGLSRATPLWPGDCELGWSPPGRGPHWAQWPHSQVLSFHLESLPPKRKVKQRGRGLVFLYFLIKCHLLSVKQLSVSCSAWGQMNISATWGLWGKAQWTCSCSCQQILLPLLCCPPESSAHPPQPFPPHPGSSLCRHRSGPGIFILVCSRQRLQNVCTVHPHLMAGPTQIIAPALPSSVGTRPQGCGRGLGVEGYPSPNSPGCGRNSRKRRVN